MNDIKKMLLLSVWAVSINYTVSAQHKQFTIAEATNGMATTLAPKTVKGASWQPGTNNLWWTNKIDGRDMWVMLNRANSTINHVSGVEVEGPKGKEYIVPAIKWLDRNNA